MQISIETKRLQDNHSSLLNKTNNLLAYHIAFKSLNYPLISARHTAVAICQLGFHGSAKRIIYALECRNVEV